VCVCGFDRRGSISGDLVIGSKYRYSSGSNYFGPPCGRHIFLYDVLSLQLAIVGTTQQSQTLSCIGGIVRDGMTGVGCVIFLQCSSLKILVLRCPCNVGLPLVLGPLCVFVEHLG